MHNDVTNLRDFYQTPLGLVARRILNQKIRARWPRLTGMSLAGFGFTTPFLGSFRGEATRTCALMPSGQGALVWPSSSRVMTVLVEAEHWPLPDNGIDRILVVHGLETAERPATVLREMWRVLAPSGRLLLVVPNRAGIWAQTDRTPFGQGRPFSRGQIEQQLRDSLFTPVGFDTALHLPPIDRGLVVRYGPTLERFGERLFQRFAGVMLVEATKELMAPIGKAVPAHAGYVLNPVAVQARPGGIGQRSSRSALRSDAVCDARRGTVTRLPVPMLTIKVPRS